MLVKVSKQMAKELNRNLKDIEVFYEELDFNQYERNVDIYSYMHDEDWVGKSNKFKVLRLVYPAEYYAIDRYVTSGDLAMVYRHAKGNTIDDYMEQFKIEFGI